ncbi:MAG TPA: CoA transferase [Dehalococcoidia bacterium]|nr:CoA transferase [Dehalococcoidia bacterium]
MEKVLTGIRILDFSRWLAAPYAATLLSDMGADVIRVEKPGGELDRELGPFAPSGIGMVCLAIARNKRGITLNLGSDKGKEILQGLVRCSDVVLHNFTSGAEEAKILGYPALKEINPAIIVIAISGFGTTGPYAEHTAFDTIGQALSGAMSYTGFPGNPPTRSGVAWVDYSTAVHGALGVVLALYHRALTGKGQMIDVALLDVAVAPVALAAAAAEYKVLGEVRQQIGNHGFNNFTDCFQAKDGWVMMSVVGNPLWRRFLRAIGREDLKDDPNFKDDLARFKNRHLTHPIVAEWTKERTTKEIIERLAKARVPCDKVNNIAEMIEHPQVKAREMLVDMEYPGVGSMPVPGVTIKMSETPGSIERRAPKVGEHNKEVYSELLGLAPKELSRLEAEGVI